MKLIATGIAVLLITAVFPQMGDYMIGPVHPFYAIGGGFIGWGVGVVQSRGWSWRW